MYENNELVKLVVAVLRGINANAEIMKHINTELGIEDEPMLTRLGNLAADDLIDQITAEVVDQGEEIIEHWDVEVYDKNIDLTDVQIDYSVVKSTVRRVINQHFEII